MGVSCSEPIYHDDDDDDKYDGRHRTTGYDHQNGGCNVLLNFRSTVPMRLTPTRKYSIRELDDTFNTPVRSTGTVSTISTHSSSIISPFDCSTGNDDNYDEEEEELVMGSNVKLHATPLKEHSPTTVMEFPVSMELVLLELISRHLIRRPYEESTEYLITVRSIQTAILQQYLSNNSNPLGINKDSIQSDVTLKMGNVRNLAVGRSKSRSKSRGRGHGKRYTQYHYSRGSSKNGSNHDEHSTSLEPDNDNSPRGDTHYYQISFSCMYTKIYEAFLERFPQYKYQIGLYDHESHTSNNYHDRVADTVNTCNPTIPRSILFTLNRSPFLDLEISGSLGLLSTFHSSSNRPRKSFLIVSDRQTSEPLTVCAFSNQGKESKVRIFATKPRSIGQVAACTTNDLGLHDLLHHKKSEVYNKYSTETHPRTSSRNSSIVQLYQWADIVSEDDTFPHEGARFNTYMATGLKPGQVEDKPKFVSIYATKGSPELVIFTRSSANRSIQNYNGPLEPCAVVMLTNMSTAFDKKNVRNPHVIREMNVTSHELGISFVMSIAQGIDPVMIVSMTAVIEEVTVYLMQQALT